MMRAGLSGYALNFSVFRHFLCNGNFLKIKTIEIKQDYLLFCLIKK